MNQPTDQHKTCPVCLVAYSQLDNKPEYDRVVAWSPGRALARLQKGKRTSDEAAKAKRRATLARNRVKRWPVMAKGAEL